MLKEIIKIARETSWPYVDEVIKFGCPRKASSARGTLRTQENMRAFLRHDSSSEN